jgi:hypothetical protein
VIPSVQAGPADQCLVSSANEFPGLWGFPSVQAGLAGLGYMFFILVIFVHCPVTASSGCETRGFGIRVAEFLSSTGFACVLVASSSAAGVRRV